MGKNPIFVGSDVPYLFFLENHSHFNRYILKVRYGQLYHGYVAPGHLGESIFRHNFCEAKMGDQVNRWLDAVSAIGDKYKDVCICFINNQRKLGSNTSELRTNRILRLEMMKGGTSSNNTQQKNKKLCS